MFIWRLFQHFTMAWGAGSCIDGGYRPSTSEEQWSTGNRGGGGRYWCWKGSGQWFLDQAGQTELCRGSRGEEWSLGGRASRPSGWSWRLQKLAECWWTRRENSWWDLAERESSALDLPICRRKQAVRITGTGISVSNDTPPATYHFSEAKFYSCEQEIAKNIPMITISHPKVIMPHHIAMALCRQKYFSMYLIYISVQKWCWLPIIAETQNPKLMVFMPKCNKGVFASMSLTIICECASRAKYVHVK